MVYAVPPQATSQAVVSSAGYNTLVNDVVDHQGRITTLETAPAPASAAPAGSAPVDSFAGSTDDDRLTAALQYAAAQTYIPRITLANKAYTWATPRLGFDGLKLYGPPGMSNAEKAPANMACQVTCNGGGAWLTANGTNFSVTIKDIDFKGSSGTQWLSTGSGMFDSCVFDSLSFSGFKSVIGSQAAKALFTACWFSGWWDIANSYNGAIHWGGSDCRFFPIGGLVDSATAYLSPGASNGQYHVWFDGMEKSTCGPIYVTAEGGWNGIRVSGPGIGSTSNNQGGPLKFYGLELEGRNAGQPCNGALFRQEGGIVILRDCWISYGMASPATPGHSPQDAGIVHQTAGQLVMSGCTYDTATGVVETVPFLYGAGGEARIGAQMRASKGGVWTGLPRYQAAGGTVNADTSVQSV